MAAVGRSRGRIYKDGKVVQPGRRIFDATAERHLNGAFVAVCVGALFALTAIAWGLL